jgi:hypothetical protein
VRSHFNHKGHRHRHRHSWRMCFVCSETAVNASRHSRHVLDKRCSCTMQMQQVWQSKRGLRHQSISALVCNISRDTGCAAWSRRVRCNRTAAYSNPHSLSLMRLHLSCMFMLPSCSYLYQVSPGKVTFGCLGLNLTPRPCHCRWKPQYRELAHRKKKPERHAS